MWQFVGLLGGLGGRFGAIMCKNILAQVLGGVLGAILVLFIVWVGIYLIYGVSLLLS